MNFVFKASCFLCHFHLRHKIPNDLKEQLRLFHSGFRWFTNAASLRLFFHLQASNGRNMILEFPSLSTHSNNEHQNHSGVNLKAFNALQNVGFTPWFIRGVISLIPITVHSLSKACILKIIASSYCLMATCNKTFPSCDTDFVNKKKIGEKFQLLLRLRLRSTEHVTGEQ